jgi:hypothetical protein
LFLFSCFRCRSRSRADVKKSEKPPPPFFVPVSDDDAAAVPKMPPPQMPKSVPPPCLFLVAVLCRYREKRQIVCAHKLILAVAVFAVWNDKATAVKTKQGEKEYNNPWLYIIFLPV